MTVKVVFQHDNRVCGAAFSSSSSASSKRAAADHAQTDAVHRPGDRSHADVSAAALSEAFATLAAAGWMISMLPALVPE